MSVVGSNILAGGSSSGGLPESSISLDGPVVSTENWNTMPSAPDQRAAQIETQLPAGVNSRKFTISTWVKMSAYNRYNSSYMSDFPNIFSCGSTLLRPGENTRIGYPPISPYYSMVSGAGTRRAYMDWFESGAYPTSRETTNEGKCDMFQAGVWTHVCFVFDSAQAVSSNRVRLWINGVAWDDARIGPLLQRTYGLYPDLNAESDLTAGATFKIGNGGKFYEFHHVDDEALLPTVFAQANPTTSQWEPIKYDGLYGVGGSYLDFSDGSSVESLLADRSGNGKTWTVSPLLNGETYPLYPDSAGLLASRCLDRPSFSGGLSDTINVAALDYRSTNFVSMGASGSLADYIHSFVSDGGLSLQSPRWFVTDSNPDTYLEGSWPPNVFGPITNYAIQEYQNKGVFATHGIGSGMTAYYEVTLDTFIPGSVLDGSARPWAIFLGQKNPMPCAWPFNHTQFGSNLWGRTEYEPKGVAGNDVHCLDPDTGTLYKYTDGVLNVSIVSGLIAGSGDVISIAADYDAGTIQWYRNGVLYATSTGVANAPEKGEWLPGFVIPSSLPFAEVVYTSKIYVNFGSKPFSYAIPAGYKKLTSGNMPDPVFKDPQETFAAYPRNYQIGDFPDYITSVSNLKFEPNWIMSTTGHSGQGNFAGLSQTTYGMTSATAQTLVNPDPSGNTFRTLFWGIAGVDVSTSPYVISWSPTIGTPPLGFGYNLDVDSNPGAWNSYNVVGDEYVRTFSHYAFKKGTENTLNTNGSLASQVSVNAAAGISHFNYDGVGGIAPANQYYSTVGHGLGEAPQAIILQATTKISPAATYYPDQTSPPTLWIEGQDYNIGGIGYQYPMVLGYDYLYESSSSVNGYFGVEGSSQSPPPNAQIVCLNSTRFNSINPPPISNNNKEGIKYFGTAIVSRQGFSKVGSYMGTGITNKNLPGTTGSGFINDNRGGNIRPNFVYLGFRPAWLLIVGADYFANDLLPSGNPNAPSQPYDNMNCQWIFDNAYDPRSVKNYGNIATKNRWAYMSNQYVSPGGGTVYNSATINSGGMVSMVSNGFYVGGNQWYIGRDDTGAVAPQRGLNVSNALYFYIAFAEVPQKYANGGFPFLDRFDPIVPNTPLP